MGFERTVTDSVMALESLFLIGFEELQFRLRLSVSRILGMLEHDPLKVASVLKQAYRIRSNFVHGGKFTPKERKKIENSHGSQQAFLRLLLDYTRICVIVMATMCSRSKPEMLNLIEKSLISSTAGRELGALLEPAASILKLDVTSLDK